MGMHQKVIMKIYDHLEKGQTYKHNTKKRSDECKYCPIMSSSFGDSLIVSSSRPTNDSNVRFTISMFYCTAEAIYVTHEFEFPTKIVLQVTLNPIPPGLWNDVVTWGGEAPDLFTAL